MLHKPNESDVSQAQPCCMTTRSTRLATLHRRGQARGDARQDREVAGGRQARKITAMRDSAVKDLLIAVERGQGPDSGAGRASVPCHQKPVWPSQGTELP